MFVADKKNQKQKRKEHLVQTSAKLVFSPHILWLTPKTMIPNVLYIYIAIKVLERDIWYWLL